MSRCGMTKKTKRLQRGATSLSRDSIVQAAIALLDAGGESGLTLRTLAQQLATGAGALYYHVANKQELLMAACDAIIVARLAANTPAAVPQDGIRAIALALFDALDAHPWLGSALMQSPAQMPMVRILEGLGRQVQALGVPRPALWQTTSALLHYILGVAGQNAANTRLARAQNSVRADFLDAVAGAWQRLDADAYPFTRSMADQLRTHDDREDYLAGIALILRGAAAYPTTAGP